MKLFWTLAVLALAGNSAWADNSAYVCDGEDMHFELVVEPRGAFPPIFHPSLQVNGVSVPALNTCQLTGGERFCVHQNEVNRFEIYPFVQGQNGQEETLVMIFDRQNRLERAPRIPCSYR